MTQIEIQALERRYRGNLINSLGGFKSLTLIGTQSKEGNNNLALFSSLHHLGADPALCGIIIRPNEPKQNTLGNILETGSYTVNHVLKSMINQAHQTSAKYLNGLSEFDQVALNTEFKEGIIAPFVAESKIKFACELVEKINIHLNNTTLIIGKIIQILVPPEYIQSDGYIDIESAGTITCSGLDSYHTTTRVKRLSYAKVDLSPREI
jgi:flavin reductase (DIM6/NTAB) family NADH-FMN oxidoreductase RutF